MEPRVPHLAPRDAPSRRAWPPPSQPWAMRMDWHELLFLHWPLPAAALRPHVPAGLALDTFDGSAWLGVVPFRMSGVRPRLLPALPWLSAFPEMNVRTYVTCGKRPGVWFFSLDAANPVAVRAARLGFGLPYFDARMAVERTGSERDVVRYSSARTHRGAAEARLEASYRPTGPVERSTPGGLVSFLTDRYCLYATRRGRLLRAEIDHPAWPLQPAEAELRTCTMGAQLGLALPDVAPLAHYSELVQVVGWLPQACDEAAGQGMSST